MNQWISLILPIASAVRDLVDLFGKDYGRAPTDNELALLLSARTEADANWSTVLQRMRTKL